MVGAVCDATNLRFALVTIMPLVGVANGIAYLRGMRYIVYDTKQVVQRLKSGG